MLQNKKKRFPEHEHDEVTNQNDQTIPPFRSPRMKSHQESKRFLTQDTNQACSCCREAHELA